MRRTALTLITGSHNLDDILRGQGRRSLLLLLNLQELLA
jgi:hypothetical protein